MQINKIIIFALLHLLSTNFAAHPSVAIPLRYRTFDNVNGKTNNLPIRCIMHGKDGNVWLGSSRGLFYFDGYELHLKKTPLPTGRVNCFLSIGDKSYIGCEKGLFVMNSSTNDIKKVDSSGLANVEGLASYQDYLLIASDSGLYEGKINRNGNLDKLTRRKDVPEHLLSLESIGRQLFIGGYTTLGRIDLDTGEYTDIDCDKPFVVGGFKKSPDDDFLWIGSGEGLLCYDLKSDSIVGQTPLPVVKTIDQDEDGNLLLGTDDGLFIKDTDGNIIAIRHDARIENSLAGEEIWSISKDPEGNIWLGTENGVSVSTDNQYSTTFNLPSVTNLVRGCHISSIFRDKSGILWLGGNGGIIKISDIDKSFPKAIWFTMRDKAAFIPHNRVRRLYHDEFGHIWGVTDRGLVFYDSTATKFSSVMIKDESYWTYAMDYDNEGIMWVGTFNGVHGIVCDSICGDMDISSIKSFGKIDGLSDDNISDVVFDGNKGLWVLAKGTVNHIDLGTGNISRNALPEEANGKISRILVDKKGKLWAVSPEKVILMDDAHPKEKIHTLLLPEHENPIITAVGEVNDEIWIAMDGMLNIIDKDSLTICSYMTDQWISSISHDPGSNAVWLGSLDKFIRVGSISNLAPSLHPIELTGIKVNGKPYLQGSGDTDIELSHSDNNIIISFTDHRPVGSLFSNLMYRLEGDNQLESEHGEWVPIPHGSNTLSLAHLSPGVYRLYISSANNIGSATPLINIKINPVWYLSWWAVIIYVLLGLLLFWRISHHWKIRQNLEREKKMRHIQTEQEKDKMTFLTNLALEYKSPLSLIMSILGHLRDKLSNPKEKVLLEMAQSSTMKLSSLINLSLDTYNADSLPDSPIRTKLDIINFTKDVANNCKDRLRYAANIEISSSKSPINIFADIYKMDTILSNLITNACRTAAASDSKDISIGISEDGGMLSFSISIYKNNMRHHTDGNDGSDAQRNGNNETLPAECDTLSLSVVKEYISLRKGEFKVCSGSGTVTYVVKLPILKAGTEEIADLMIRSGNDDRSAQSMSDNRQQVLIVNPDVEIAAFLKQILENDYVCHLAHNGKAGIQLCRGKMIDVIVTALDMPILNGIEMAKEFRKDSKYSTVPIILIATHTDMALEMQCIKLNIDAVFQTPVDYNMIKAKVTQLVGRHKEMERRIRIENIGISDLTPGRLPDINSDEKFLNRVVTAIEEDISNPEISVSWLASKIGMSEKQLYRKIKKLTNFTTSEYIREIRLEKAAVHLRDSNVSISEVMYMVGFSHASYFSNCFRKKFGTAPREYRTSTIQKSLDEG